METSVKQRLVQFIEYINLPVHQFEQKVGLSNGYVRNIRKSITQDKLEKIALTYPELSKEWLIFGEGEMLKCYFDEPNSPINEISHEMEEHKENSALLDAKDEIIRALQSQLADKDTIISAKDDLIRVLQNQINETKKNYNFDISFSPLGVAERPIK